MLKNTNHPLSIHIFATSYCNLSCKHCFIDAKSDFQNRFEISASDVLKIIRESTRLVENIDFELEGGEILLHSEIDYILGELSSDELSKLILTTNGTIAYPFGEIIDEQKLKQLQLRVSLEGHTQKSHEALRSSSIERIFTNIRKWRELGISIIVRVTLHEGNFQDIQNMIDKFSSIGADEIRFFEFQSAGRGALALNRGHSLDDNAYLEVLNCFSQITKPIGVRKVSFNVSSNRKLLLEPYKPILKGNGFIEKQSKGNSLCVNWDGSLALCPWNSFKTVIRAGDLSHYVEYFKKMVTNHDFYHSCEFCSYTSLRKED